MADCRDSPAGCHCAMRLTEFDVVINGAGMVGAATALALAGAGLRIGVFEAREPPAWDASVVDQRVSSLTVASRRLLVRLGAWDAMAARRVSPFDAIHAWDDHGAVYFRAGDIGEPLLGWIVENGLIQQCLLERLRQCPDVSLMLPAELTAQADEGDALRLRLSDGRRLTCRLLVGADGAASPVREAAGIGVKQRDYGQRGLVATVTTARHHGGVARQRFLPTGPLALLPLADGRSSLVWSAFEARASALQDLDDTAFAEALTVASDGVLGQVTAVSGRAAFPLRARHAERYIARRVALVGDAAHVIHPLAGQGVNLGFMDAAALAETVTAATAARRDPGARGVLRRYERWRRGDNRRMQWSMDAFHWLFASSDPVRHAARNLGFLATNRLAPIKAVCMRHAMGLRGELPALMRDPVAGEYD